MMRSLWTAASGMRAQQVNVDTIANNVANINTIGYKSQQASSHCCIRTCSRHRRTMQARTSRLRQR